MTRFTKITQVITIKINNNNNFAIMVSNFTIKVREIIKELCLIIVHLFKMCIINYGYNPNMSPN